MAALRPNRYASPRLVLGGVRGGKRTLRRGSPAPNVGSVHDVVVEQGEGVEHLDRRPDRDRRRVVVCAGGPMTPVHETGPQTLPAGGDQAVDLIGDSPQRVVDRPELVSALVDELR